MTTDDIAASAPQINLKEMGSPQAKAKQSVIGSLINRLRSIIRIWAVRDRDRQELLNLLDQDHRTAADMGSTTYDLKTWAQKPFWRP